MSKRFGARSRRTARRTVCGDESQAVTREEQRSEDTRNPRAFPSEIRRAGRGRSNTPRATAGLPAARSRASLAGDWIPWHESLPPVDTRRRVAKCSWEERFAPRSVALSRQRPRSARSRSTDVDTLKANQGHERLHVIEVTRDGPSRRCTPRRSPLRSDEDHGGCREPEPGQAPGVFTEASEGRMNAMRGATG